MPTGRTLPHSLTQIGNASCRHSDDKGKSPKPMHFGSVTKNSSNKQSFGMMETMDARTNSHRVIFSSAQNTGNLTKSHTLAQLQQQRESLQQYNTLPAQVHGPTRLHDKLTDASWRLPKEASRVFLNKTPTPTTDMFNGPTGHKKTLTESKGTTPRFMTKQMQLIKQHLK